jgi:hypothetical protein
MNITYEVKITIFDECKSYCCDLTQPISLVSIQILKYLRNSWDIIRKYKKEVLVLVMFILDKLNLSWLQKLSLLFNPTNFLSIHSNIGSIKEYARHLKLHLNRSKYEYYIFSKMNAKVIVVIRPNPFSKYSFKYWHI